MTSKQSVVIAIGFIVPPLLCLIAIAALANLARADELEEKRMGGNPAAAPAVSPPGESRRRAQDALDASIEEARAREAALDQSIREKNSSVARLKDDLTVQSETATSLEELRARVAAAEKQRTESSTQLDALKQSQAQQEKILSVMALSGKHKTNTRPATFVECVADGVLLQPRQERFSIRPAAAERGAFTTSIKETDYVVFLIRPDGFESFWQYYRLARSANVGAETSIDVGYEPVNADWHLLYLQQKGQAHARS